VEIDVELLKSEIKKTYASVSEEPEKDFIFPTGAWAEDLDYPAELANVPESAVESFCRRRQPMGNGSARTRRAGARPQLRRGHSTDSLIAAQMVGEQGRVSGIDMTHEMLAKARAAASEMGAINVDFVEGEAEQLPSPTRASTL
jgi:arsenite methyltransferase